MFYINFILKRIFWMCWVIQFIKMNFTHLVFLFSMWTPGHFELPMRPRVVICLWDRLVWNLDGEWQPHLTAKCVPF